MACQYKIGFKRGTPSLSSRFGAPPSTFSSFHLAWCYPSFSSSQLLPFMMFKSIAALSLLILYTWAAPAKRDDAGITLPGVGVLTIPGIAPGETISPEEALSILSAGSQAIATAVPSAWAQCHRTTDLIWLIEYAICSSHVSYRTSAR
ncbi:hypothetical protein C8Q70DRAFT_189590 [Cubamyces menziesii]|nr:hypothetical protein C8Q70DRAFT_189590 [Cubamyces menziesii]